MSRTQPPARVPTLTEVLDAKLVAGDANRPPTGARDDGLPTAAAPDGQSLSEAEIAERIRSELQAHIDRVLDARVRAALAPILEQTVTKVLEETRRELAATMRDGLARALAQQISRHPGTQ